MYKPQARRQVIWVTATVAAIFVSAAGQASDSVPPTERYHPEVITLPAAEPPQLASQTNSECDVSGYSRAPQFFVRRVSRERQLCASQTTSDLVADNHSVVTLEQPESH